MARGSDDDYRIPGAQALAEVVGDGVREEVRLLVKVYEVFHGFYNGSCTAD
jgi:hypothetical protein